MSTISIEHNEKNYEAEYFVDQGLVTVYGERGQETTQIGGLTEQQTAKQLLGTLIRKGLIDPVELGST